MNMVSDQSLQPILSYHEEDNEQLEFITSQERKVVVQAPAGYGKTRTMISKLAYIIATHQILAPKKILALTFSVNAAYKIKKDVVEQLPSILQEDKKRIGVTINNKISVSNYHGFCRKVLSRYGYLIHEKLRDINIFTAFDDGTINNIAGLGLNTLDTIVVDCTSYNEKLKEANAEYLREHFNTYNNHVLEEFIPHEYIPFNAILTLTIKLFHEHSKVLAFYQKLFPIIIVDEFQDTNFFSYTILKKLIVDQTTLYLMGDSLQRIYGFIGAIPNILDDAKEQYNMKMIELKNNYRFKDNPNMLLLDYNVRRNAESLTTPKIESNTQINLMRASSQHEEAMLVLSKCQELLEQSTTDKIAVLFRNGFTNKNTLKILDEFDSNEIDYFFGLFSDEDPRYREFHFACAKSFSELLKSRRISRKACDKHIRIMTEQYEDEANPLFDSLIELMKLFYSRLYTEYSFLLLDDEDKIILIKETFEGFGLKQYIEYVDSRIVISTIHGAKGLEWEYVIMPDVEQYSLPNWYGYCGDCSHKNDCQPSPTSLSHKYLDELSVFYVGFTRAKKEVYFSASSMGINSRGDDQSRNLSCFLTLEGIEA